MPDKVSAHGHTSVILVVNMNQFVANGEPIGDNQKRFERLRGTRHFAKVLEETWHPRLLEDEMFAQQEGARHLTTDERGYVLGMFRRSMLREYSSRMYRVNKEAIHRDPLLEKNWQYKKSFAPVWRNWEIYVRPTVTGMLIIRLVRRYEQSGKPRWLFQMTRDVIDMQGAFNMASAFKERERRQEELDDLRRSHPVLEPDSEAAQQAADLERKIAQVNALLDWLGAHDPEVTPTYIPVQWQLASEICRYLIEAVGNEIQVEGERKPVRLEPASAGVTGQLQDTYVIYHLDRLYSKFSKEVLYEVRSDVPVAPQEIKHCDQKRGGQPLSEAHQFVVDDIRQRLQNMLEGAMLKRPPQARRDRNEFSLEFPQHKPNAIDHILEQDQATWNDELCLLTSRTAIIMPADRYQDRELYISSLPPSGADERVDYPGYWDAFERLIEFTVEVRVLAQFLERSSSDILNRFVPMLNDMRSKLHHESRLRIENYQGITDLFEQSANLLRLVALCQSLNNPHTWSRAEYALHKAECLLREMRVERLLENAESNVTNLARFVDHVDELYLFERSERSNQSNRFQSLLLGVLSLSVILFSLPSFWRDSEELRGWVIPRFVDPNFISALACLGSMLAFGLLSAAIAFLIYAFMKRETEE